MELNQIYNEQREAERLITQTDLFSSIETPVIKRLTEGRSGLNVLDIGCNNGKKTLKYFSSERFQKVIGVEYNSEIVQEAQATISDPRFVFYRGDAEADDFTDNLAEIMRLNNIRSFDIIFISLVLMHLRAPAVLLERLREFLSPDGYLLITEANDTTTAISSDKNDLVKVFVKILGNDPYAGNRSIGPRLPDILAGLGYSDISVECDSISADADDPIKKNTIFETYFSFLPPEIKSLHMEFPDDLRYAEWSDWMDNHFHELRQEILFGSADVSMGVRVLKCSCPAKKV